MGNRYTWEEIDQIQALTEKGLTISEIARRLGRSENGVRNIRYRLKIKTDTRESLKQLSSDRQKFIKDVNRSRWDLHSLQSKKKDVEKALQAIEATLDTR